MRQLNYTDYLLALGDAKFVLSPPGAGIDCYRTWESLIMGAVPIVVNNSLLSLYDDMPVMIIDGNWTNDVTIDTLTSYENEHKRRLIQERLTIARRPKIWAKYWIDSINRYRQFAQLS